MRVGQDTQRECADFLSIEKNLALIVNKFLSNDNLCKLLYYTQKDCLKADNLTMEQKQSMIGHQLRVVPKIDIEGTCPNYVIITFDKFIPNAHNPEYNDFTITIDILCHPDHWNLSNFQLRPYKIAGEINAMLNNAKMVGIGELLWIGGANLALDDQTMGVTLAYRATHGMEDSNDPLS